MKKYLFIVVLLYCSCAKNDFLAEIGVDDETSAASMSFFARTESPDDSTVTKAYLSGYPSTSSTRYVYWDLKDSIYVCNAIKNAIFKNVSNSYTDAAQFSGSLDKTDIFDLYAAYPCDYVTSFYYSTFYLKLPSTQTYTKDNISPEGFPMVALLKNDTFEFKNLCGILVLSLTGTSEIKEIRFSGIDSTNMPIKIVGDATVKMTYTSAPSIKMSSNATELLTLNCVDTLGKGVTLDSTTPTYFHLVIPESTFNQFTIEINSVDGKSLSIYSDKILEIKRSRRTTTSTIDFDDPSKNVSSNHEYVDLGLSVLWATCNVGASKPEDYGDYYGWGEIVTRSNYTWSNYTFQTSGDSYSDVKFRKYNTNSSYGTVDNKTTLDSSDDVAKYKWGSTWRIPTLAEFEELINSSNCSVVWTTFNGISGCKITSKKAGYEGKSIFLPASGYRESSTRYNSSSSCYYWTNTLVSTSPYNAYYFYSGNSGSAYTSSNYRYRGRSVRPVCSVPPTSSGTTTFNLSSISLNKKSLQVSIGGDETLTATVTNNNVAVNLPITWTSSNTSVATVDANGVVHGVTEGSAVITVSCVNLTASCNVVVSDRMVDLGLSVMWAKYNIGGVSPSDYGNYYSWGEVSTKSNYTWETYDYRVSGTSSSNIRFKKYNTDSSYGNSDGKTMLESSDDVAHNQWGGKWRMPTQAEFQELINNCYWYWTTYNGYSGYRITSNVSGYENNYIFLPAAGYREGTSRYSGGSYGYYWSMTLSISYPYYGSRLYISSGSHYTGNNYRYYGCSVRAVWDPNAQ